VVSVRCASPFDAWAEVSANGSPNENGGVEPVLGCGVPDACR
jgi:hypothetical protein